MRRTLVAASLLAASGLVLSVAAAAPAVPSVAPAGHSDESGRRFITIGADALSTVFEVATADHSTIVMVAANREVAVMGVDADELDHLAEAMHTHHDRCGGFIVHDSLADALEAAETAAAAKAIDEPGSAGRGSAPEWERGSIDYTLDRAAVVEAVLPAIRPDEILSTIRSLSSRKNRYYRSESGAAVSLWLRDRWRGFTDRSDVSVDLFDQGYPQQSVIMTIRGTTRPDEIVVIGGHLDSIGPLGTASDAPGADDDASGIATLDHIARTLLTSGFRPERTIQFMAYAAEEVGLRGSQAIVRDYKRRGLNVVGALQLDMTNYQGSDRDIWLIDDFTSAAQNRFLAQLIERYTKATWGSDVCGYACSDHASWHRAGVPASMPFETRSRDRNKNIHTARDTLEVSNNNAAHAAKFAQLGAAYAIELAKGTLVPPGGTRVRVCARAHNSQLVPLAAAPSSPGVPGWKLIGMLVTAVALLGLGRRIG